ISKRLPHPYDGSTDFRAWLRRYETAADAAQWSDVAPASRLGMYLEDDYFDSWEQLADKKDWSVDKALMLSLFAKRSPDEALRAFSPLQWDGQQKFVVFAARLIRYLKEYNRALPEGQRMSAEAMTRQVFDRCVDVAPEGAQQELRKQTDHSIQAVSIVDDYNPGTVPTRSTRPSTKAPLVAEAQPALPTIIEAVQTAMAPLVEGLATSIRTQTPHQGQNRYNGNRRGSRGGRSGGRNGGCGLQLWLFQVRSTRSSGSELSDPLFFSPEFGKLMLRSPPREPPAGSVVAERPEAAPRCGLRCRPRALICSLGSCGVIDTGRLPVVVTIHRQIGGTGKNGPMVVLGRRPAIPPNPTAEEVVPGLNFPAGFTVIEFFERRYVTWSVRLSVPRDARGRMPAPNILDWMVNSLDPVVIAASR
ncbi:hypothetical protein FOL47_000405, partial [Perkinsus chesapeaki]